MYVYIQSEKPAHDTSGLWTAGFYAPNGDWKPESDHQSPEEAAERVAWLNGSPKLAKVDVVFDGLPGPEGPRFIEVEDMHRASIKLGEWITRDDGYAALRFRAELSS